MERIIFRRIDNGYKCKPSYQCSNGLTIEPGDGLLDIYRYYVNNRDGETIAHFDYLADAKLFCKKFL